MSSVKQQLPLAVLTGWIITIGAWIWNTSEVKSNFEYRIRGLEDNTQRWNTVCTELERIVKSKKTHEMFIQCKDDIRHNQELFLASKKDRLESILKWAE